MTNYEYNLVLQYLRSGIDQWVYDDLKICKQSIDRNNDTIINNINSRVKSNDTLYHLGDFSYGPCKPFRDRINCKNLHLIRGNHDYFKVDDSKCFSTISEIKEIRYAKQHIILCHYAMRVWNRSHHGSICLYGHSHNMLPAIKNSFDVGVDCHNFSPISVDEVLEKVKC